MELLTLHKGSQPHVMLLDLFRTRRMEPKMVRAISSILAMVQLARAASVWPCCRAPRWSGLPPFARLKLLNCAACSVTPQWIAQSSWLPLRITHAPGKMLVTDLKNNQLANL